MTAEDPGVCTMELGLDCVYDICSYSTCDGLMDATRKSHTV